MKNKPEYSRFLPHYHPKYGTFFITFHLKDSLHKTFFDDLSNWYQTEKDKIEYSIVSVLNRDYAMAELQRAYFYKLDDALDKCEKSPTHLKNPLAAGCVVTQLQRFDGVWYRLIAYTILSNHVHAIMDFSVQLTESNKPVYVNLDIAMERIKGASARYANLALGRTGNSLWDPEYHDRYIRNRQHLLAAIDYIKQNPVKANIVEHWKAHPFTWVHEMMW